jgi:hypothetical protein
MCRIFALRSKSYSEFYKTKNGMQKKNENMHAELENYNFHELLLGKVCSCATKCCFSPNIFELRYKLND